jgi:hypothetical protein
MHALAINLFFPPSPAPTGQLLAELADSLPAQGNEVTIVFSRSDYTTVTHKRRPEVLRPHFNMVAVPGPRFSHGSLARLSCWL